MFHFRTKAGLRKELDKCRAEFQARADEFERDTDLFTEAFRDRDAEIERLNVELDRARCDLIIEKKRRDADIAAFLALPEKSAALEKRGLTAFVKPIVIELEATPDDSYLSSACYCFLQYAQAMMYPDPIGVEISDEAQNYLTTLINAGTITHWDALRCAERGYDYGDDGLEYMAFLPVEELRKKFASRCSERAG